MTAAEARVLLVPSSDFLSETSDLSFKTALCCRRSMSKKQIYYSDKYTDDDFEYRHVVLPKQLAKLVPTSHLMTEEEWRGLGVQQSQGWMHYMVHKPEPHILLFRRPLPKDLKE